MYQALWVTQSLVEQRVSDREAEAAAYRLTRDVRQSRASGRGWAVWQGPVHLVRALLSSRRAGMPVSAPGTPAGANLAHIPANRFEGEAS